MQQEETRIFGGSAVGAAAIMACGAAVVGNRRSTAAARRRGGQHAGPGYTARSFFGGASTPTPPPKPMAIPVLPEPRYRQLDDPFLAEMEAGSRGPGGRS